MENPDNNLESTTQGVPTSCEGISPERYQAFVENIQEGVYEVDLHGNFQYFNQSLCRIFGYPREEILYQNFTKFMDKEYAEKAFEAFGRIYSSGQGIADITWKINCKDGTQKVIELSANLIIDSGGEKVGFRGIIRDITDKFNTQEALRRSERRYRTLLDFAPYPVVVFNIDEKVSYLNPAFTDTFGWTLDELEGTTIPYVPEGLEKETRENMDQLFRERFLSRHETQRLTKDGGILDVVMRAAVYSEPEDETPGAIIILRDITREKRISRNNQALLKISLALPEYPQLEGLLDYISGQVKWLMNAEGAVVILLDEEKNELFFKAAAHDNTAAEKRFKEVRYHASKGVSGKVIRTGKPIIVPDTSKDPHFYSVVDVQAGIQTRNMLDVPLKYKGRTIGVLCVQNKKNGAFDQTDVELLNMVSGTVALSIENVRYSEELQDAYKEVSSLNRAKDKVINHLSHELRTPLSVLIASLNALSTRLASLPKESWQPTLERARRNLNRILEMQYQVEDIMAERHYHTYRIASDLLDQCSDLLESLVVEQIGEHSVVDRVRRRIEELFGPKQSPSQEIHLHTFAEEVLEKIRPDFSHRDIELRTYLEPVPRIKIPPDVLEKVITGLIKNAVENTPDQGRIEILTHKRGKGVELEILDYGIGILPENQERIFEGFFTTQDTMQYSSKQPFDFNAGGRGADLLRMKNFSERYGFKIEMESARCRDLPHDTDICPGNISACAYCAEKKDCLESGGTTFRIFFPEALEEGPSGQDART